MIHVIRVYMCLEEKRNFTSGHRRPEGGGQPGAVAPTLEFENYDVICCFRAKYPKIFVRAFGAPKQQAIFVSSCGFAPLWKNSCGRP